jgi:hypothetical protein
VFSLIMRKRVSCYIRLNISIPFHLSRSQSPSSPSERVSPYTGANSRSIALPVLTLFPFCLPPVLSRFPAFLGPISTGTLFPPGRPFLRAEPGVDAWPRFWRMR